MTTREPAIQHEAVPDAPPKDPGMRIGTPAPLFDSARWRISDTKSPSRANHHCSLFRTGNSHCCAGTTWKKCGAGASAGVWRRGGSDSDRANGSRCL